MPDGTIRLCFYAASSAPSALDAWLKRVVSFNDVCHSPNRHHRTLAALPDELFVRLHKQCLAITLRPTITQSRACNEIV